jgi:hypothetical protein
MKIKLALGLSIIAGAGLANAAIYTFNNAATGVGDTLYANSSGALMSGTVIQVGTFTPGFNLNANLGSSTALISNFIVAGNSLTTGLAIRLTGSPSDSFGLTNPVPGYAEYAPIDSDNIVTGNALIGQLLYAFGGNAATLALSTEYFLFLVATIADDAAAENEYVVNPAGITPLIGTVGTFTGNPGFIPGALPSDPPISAGVGQGNYLTLNTIVPIPEPSAALLGAVGVLGLLRRRRN